MSSNIGLRLDPSSECRQGRAQHCRIAPGQSWRCRTAQLHKCKSQSSLHAKLDHPPCSVHCVACHHINLCDHQKYQHPKCPRITLFQTLLSPHHCPCQCPLICMYNKALLERTCLKAKAPQAEDLLLQPLPCLHLPPRSGTHHLHVVIQAPIPKIRLRNVLAHDLLLLQALLQLCTPPGKPQCTTFSWRRGYV